MDHSTVLQKLPSSIYTKEANSNNAKLWNLYSSEANLIENSLVPFYDVANLSGINLDKMSLILGIERDGMTDEQYRDALLNSQETKGDTASLPALYDAVGKVCSKFKITELAYAREYEPRVLDGNGFMDGTQNMDPSVLRPRIIFRLDGSIIADGSEPLEPCFIRPASILIEVIASDTYLDEVIHENFDPIDFAVSGGSGELEQVLLAARSVLISGIAIYIKEIT